MRIGGAMFFTDYSMSSTELARALEERGFDSLWVPEHSHIPLTRKSPFPSGGELPKKYYDVMDPFVVLGAAAAVTKTLLLGTGICLIAQRDPIQTAKQVSSIDQVSGGRFLFGIGNGWNEDEMANHGTVFASRHKLARERVEAMKEIWTASKAEYHGEFVNFDPMMTWPKPVQKPHPPIIVGGAFPFGARRALRYGDGWMPHRTRSQYADVQALLPKFREMATEAGRCRSDGAEVVIDPLGEDELVVLLQVAIVEKRLELFQAGQVVGADEQLAARRLAVAPRAADLLRVVLQALGQVVVIDGADVGLVDAHAEGDGRDNDGVVGLREPLLDGRTLLVLHAGVVVPGGEFRLRQPGGDLFGGLAERGVDDGRAGRAPAEAVPQGGEAVGGAGRRRHQREGPVCVDLDVAPGWERSTCDLAHPQGDRDSRRAGSR